MEGAKRELSEDERLDWLRLSRAESVGPITFQKLLRHFGTVAAAIEAAPELSRRGGRKRPIRIPPRRDVADEIRAIAALGGRYIALCEPDYPLPLAAIPDPPPLISVLGHAHLLGRPAVGIVGARNASAAGRRMARELAHGLGEAGYVVASGMARGIDAAAHEAGLDTGTAAAMAGGADIVYPEQNQGLYEEIVARGVAVSEQPPGTRPTARHFPPRNRLISGLSLGVLVVEAAHRSGSLITARLALEQGREVFAVPGSPLDPRCRGTNDLIRNGAVLTESADDVIEVLRSLSTPRLEAPAGSAYGAQPSEIPMESELKAGRARLLECLGPTAVTVDELIRECQLSPAAVQILLLELELAGRVERHPGDRVAFGA